MLNADQKILLQREHSAILLTFIKLPFVIKIFVLSIFEWTLEQDNNENMQVGHSEALLVACAIIRIYHECQGGIGKSVPRIMFGITISGLASETVYTKVFSLILQ